MQELSIQPSFQVLTVNELEFRNFVRDKKTNEFKESNSKDCRVSKSIPFQQFVLSKEPGRRSKALNEYSGHQILHGIHERIRNKTKTEYQCGQVFVYRDSMSHPGYVSKMTPETQNSSLLVPETPITELVFERFIGTIDLISNYAAAESVQPGHANLRLAVKYEDDKLELAMGTNIRICDNFNIFGNTRQVTGRNLSYGQMMENLDEWLSDIEQKFGSDLECINRLASKPISRSQCHRYLGEMLEMYHTKDSVMQVTDITQVASRFNKKDVNNYWDLTQIGTEVIRFDNNSGNSVLENIEKWNNFMIEKL
jgi:hypothetical protein